MDTAHNEADKPQHQILKSLSEAAGKTESLERSGTQGMPKDEHCSS